jgi:hypothetical protein
VGDSFLFLRFERKGPGDARRNGGTQLPACWCTWRPGSGSHPLGYCPASLNSPQTHTGVCSAPTVVPIIFCASGHLLNLRGKSSENRFTILHGASNNRKIFWFPNVFVKENHNAFPKPDGRTSSGHLPHAAPFQGTTCQDSCDGGSRWGTVKFGAWIVDICGG